MNNNIIFLSIIVGIMAIHSNTLSSKYNVTDFLLLICIICSSIYIFYYNKNNENMGNVYLRHYKNIAPDPNNGLVSELISNNMKESSDNIADNTCKKKCDETDNCKFYKITNSNINNPYNEFEEGKTIEGACTIYKGSNKPDKHEKISSETNLHTYLYEKIFRLYFLRNHPAKGLLFIPYTYENGKFKSLAKPNEEIYCNSDKSSQSNLAYCTSSHGVLEMLNLTNTNDNNILDFRSSASNKIVQMKADSEIILNKKDAWLLGVTFMISKKKNNDLNILLSGKVKTTGLQDSINKDIIYVNRDNRLMVFDIEILNTNKIYTVSELDTYSIYPQDNEEKDQYITIILENDIVDNRINIYYKALYETNSIINKYTNKSHKLYLDLEYNKITIESIGGMNNNPYFGVIKNMIFSKIGINSSLLPLDCSSITPLDECNKTIGCIRDASNTKCVPMKQGQCVADTMTPLLIRSILYKNKDGTDTVKHYYGRQYNQMGMGKDICKNICLKNNKNVSIYGTQYSEECFCGNKLDKDAYIASDTNCNNNCLYNTKEKCGGAWHSNVYMIKKTNELTLEKLFEILRTETTEYIEEKEEIDENENI